MPQYYFGVKLIAKKRQVKIRQQKIKKIRDTQRGLKVNIISG